MIKHRSSWSIARSALAGGSLAVAALVSVTPVQARQESDTTPAAEHADAAPKANTGKKVARDTKARGDSKKSAHREAHASKSKKSNEEKNQKVAKVEKSKSSNEDSMNGSSDDPLEGL
jgi:hypothetical protein